MKQALSRLFIILFSWAALSATAPAQQTSELPIEVFASLPSFSSARLSPSGTKIAFRTDIEGRSHLAVTDLKSKETVVVPPNENADIGSFFWGNEETLVITFTVTRERQGVGRLLTESKLFSFNIKSQEYVWLARPKRRAGSMMVKGIAAFSEQLVHTLPKDPKHILMAMDEDLVGRPDVFKVNIETGRRKKVKGGKRGIHSWFADQQGNIRLGFGFYRTGGGIDSEKRVAVLFDKKGNETNLTKTDWADDYNIVDFSPDPNIVYVSGKTEYGTDGIFTLDLRTGEIVEPVFAHEKVDVEDTMRNPATGNVAGVGYTVDTFNVHYFDEDLALIQRSLQKALGGNVYITGKARKKDLYLVVATALNNPGDYFLFDRKAKKVDFVSAIYDAIYPEDMVSALIVDVPTRDGDAIPAYVTLPKGAEEGSKLPTVILPHGGPHARDTADWEFWSQFYANRGYAVMRPNFRGSTGYGEDFYEKGRKRWGGLMQDDVTDATHWMIEQGYTDPERICIVGASYGGYAAMFAPIKEPGLYKCAISVNGVPDIPDMKRSDEFYSGFSSWIENVGLRDHPDEEVSPYHRAEEINIPLLLMSSVDDARVPYKMSQRMQSRMESLGKDSIYIQIDDGGHSMITKEARMTLLTETEKFLDKHIGK